MDLSWDRNWTSSGTGGEPDLVPDLAPIWYQIWPRSGTRFGPNLGPDLAQPVGDAAQQRAVPGSNPGRPRDWKSASADGNVFQRPPKFGATTREKTCTHHTLVSPRRTLVPSTLSAAVSQRIGARGGGNGADETFVYCIRRHGESATRTNFKNRKRETAELRARKKCCAFLPKGSEGGLAPPDCLRGLGRLNAG